MTADSWALETSKTSAVQAYERLKRAIVDGDLAPGERLAESRIATLLGVSRTPVREAFARLVKDGLLCPAPRGGVVVVDPRDEFIEIFHLREAIEGCAARLAALRATADEKAGIMALAEEGKAAPPSDVQARARLNEAFHLGVARAAHAPRVAQLVSNYQALFASPLILKSYSLQETGAAKAAHMRIACAIRDGDADAAEAAMRGHLRASGAAAMKAALARLPRGDVAVAMEA
jgi:DNA-binding GntR family transcriptional regulator